jgi:hypothetical protein
LTIPKGKRNRAVIALLLPVIIFLWIVGWGLFWIGYQKESRKNQSSPSPKEEDSVRIVPIMFEEPSEIES